MKTILLSVRSKKITSAIAAAIIVLSLNSCAVKKDFLLSSVVPAARGNVKIQTDKNKNYTVKVKVENLAEAERLASKNSTYIVWLETADNDVKNLGQMMSSRGVISKALSATLETKTAFKPARIFITAEEDAALTMPREQIVLSTDRF